MEEKSLLEAEMVKLQHHLPHLLTDIQSIECIEGEPTSSLADNEELKKRFSKTYGQPVIRFKRSGIAKSQTIQRVGVVLSGGQAPGGHNVIAGLFDALRKIHPRSKLFGFINGPSGIIENNYKELTKEMVDRYRNTGGFDLLGSGRDKIEKEHELKASLENCRALDLTGLVIIGGDDSNTNAAILAEYFLHSRCEISVIGVPKTIDGDLKNLFVETSFGFDTACKIYSEMIGNLARDCLSAKKYTHFIKLMGRSASHIALECAMQTHPNLTLIGEEINENKLSLKQITRLVADGIVKRALLGKNYGIILIPEGLIEFIGEIKLLIKELNTLLAKDEKDPSSKLSSQARDALEFMPEKIRRQLLMDRDPHGNIQVSLIDIQHLFIEKVKEELKNRPDFKGKFHPIGHFFGYEGRCGFPSRFDANYCYALGFVSAGLILSKKTGYMSSLQGLMRDVESWEAAGLPLTMMMHMEERKGQEKPVIQKALVDLEGPVFKSFAEKRERWIIEDDYRYPGPIQFFGPKQISEQTTITLQMEQKRKVDAVFAGKY